MIKICLIFFGLFTFTQALADTFQSTVNEINPGKDDSPHIVKFDNARVLFLDGEDKDELRNFQESLRNHETLEVSVDPSNGLQSVQALASFKLPDSRMSEVRPMISYEPTVVTDLAETTAIFGRMRRDYQNHSQCYNRAHVWTYEEYKGSGLRSMKLFMFFTNRYIRKYRYGWWFHVTPMVQTTIQDENGSHVVERTLDRRYTASPLDVKSWSDIFIYSKRKCPRVEKYNDYRNNQESEDCYHISVPMYFWQPADILTRDQTGAVKIEYISREVNWAYQEAF